MNLPKRLDRLEQRLGILERKGFPERRLTARIGAALKLLTDDERRQFNAIAKAMPRGKEEARLREERADSLAAETAQEIRDAIRLAEEQGLIEKRPNADHKPHDR